MELRGLHHLVLLVDDVPVDEAYYRELFDLELLFREGALDGEPGTVPEAVDWDEALAKGVTPYMSFLGRDEFFLAVAQADGEAADGHDADSQEADSETTTGRVDHVALAVDERAFEAITERAEELGSDVERNAAHHRTFRDRLGIEWELNAKPRPPGRAFEPLDI